MVIRGAQDSSRRCRLVASEGGLSLTDAFGDDHLPRTAEVLNRRFSKAAPCGGSEQSEGEDLWTKGCAERGAGATPPLYNFNLWWMIAEERSGGDKYERVRPRRSSIMPCGSRNFSILSVGRNGSLHFWENYLWDNWGALIKNGKPKLWRREIRKCLSNKCHKRKCF